MFRFFSSILFCLCLIPSAKAEIVTFKASDGLEITANLQEPEKSYSTLLILFHMAGASRGEYKEIAKQLNEMGYATLAVDQRSGKSYGGVKNETAARIGKKQSYIKAIPDLIAASNWVRSNYSDKKVGVMGSSYSSSLVLLLQGRDAGFSDAVMSFSPGEYFGNVSVSKQVANITVPVFLTSAKNEVKRWKPFSKQLGDKATGFTPKGKGKHGATALISNDAKEYWEALTAFLNANLPPQ